MLRVVGRRMRTYWRGPHRASDARYGTNLNLAREKLRLCDGITGKVQRVNEPSDPSDVLEQICQRAAGVGREPTAFSHPEDAHPEPSSSGGWSWEKSKPVTGDFNGKGLPTSPSSITTMTAG